MLIDQLTLLQLEQLLDDITVGIYSNSDIHLLQSIHSELLDGDRIAAAYVYELLLELDNYYNAGGNPPSEDTINNVSNIMYELLETNLVEVK